jgi:hypothetical protein
MAFSRPKWTLGTQIRTFVAFNDAWSQNQSDKAFTAVGLGGSREILVRRHIYEQRYLAQWQISLRLVRRYRFVGRGADAALGALALKGFKICVQQARHQHSLEAQVAQSRLFFLRKADWRLHFSFLSAHVDRNLTDLLIRRAFAQWQGKLHQIEVCKRKVVAGEI